MKNKLKSILKFLNFNESSISTFLGMLVVITVVLLIFNYVKQSKTESQISQEAATQESTNVSDMTEEANQQGNVAPKDLPKEYEVKENDNLWTIAQANYGSGYNWVDIAKENELANPNILLAGQKLKLPKVEVKTVDSKNQATADSEVIEGKVNTEKAIIGDSYQVVKGDNLWTIAVRAYQDGYKWPDLAKANNLSNPDFVQEGQKLIIPRK